MDIEPNCKQHDSTKVEFHRENKNILEKSVVIDSRCMDNREETMNGIETLLDEQSKAPEDPEDLEVDVITCTNVNETRSAEAEDPDATEYSSSFTDTISDTERCSGLSEAEVESQFFGDSDLASPYDAFSSIFQTRCVSVSCSSFCLLIICCFSHGRFLYENHSCVFMYSAFLFVVANSFITIL